MAEVDLSVPRGYMPEGPEWGTFALMIGCYLGWLVALFLLPQLSVVLALVLAVSMITLHASLCHEALHGHPFRSRPVNEALMFLPLNLMVPFGRFRDTHLAHHEDDQLTDPYDDPESNFQDPEVWGRLPSWRRGLLRLNNTLLGRMVIGPAMGQICFMVQDARLIRTGDWRVLRDWILHGLGVAMVLWVVVHSPMGLAAYGLAVYAALSVLKIRTFLEHQAHEDKHGRTAIIEGQGILAFLFLNNNLHIVHHLHPGVPWHHLPALYRAKRLEYQRVNHGYVLPSYFTVFRRYFLRSKDPVPHPLWQVGE